MQEDVQKVIHARVSPDEHRRVKIAAVLAGDTIQDFVRRVLIEAVEKIEHGALK